MPARFPIAKLLALGAGASVVALGEGLLVPGVFSAGMGVGGGLLHFLFNREANRLITDDSPSPSSLIQNHDLRKLVGEAIADTLRLSAGEGPGKAEAADTIEQLAEGAADLWKNLATATDTDYADFDEQSVADLFAREVTNFKDVKSLDSTTWRGFLDSLNDATHADAEDALLGTLANRLHQSLAEMLRAKVKQDFTGKTPSQGRGFASLHLMLMGRLTAGVDQLLEQSSGGAISAELLEEIKKLNQRLPNAADQEFGRVDDPEERAALSSTLEEIKQWGPRVEGRLNELAKAVAVADVASRRGHAQTHGWLKWVVGSLATVGVLGFAGWSMIHLSQEAHAEQLVVLTALVREAQGPKVIGEDPTKRELPPEVLDAARELQERGNREQQALGKSALGDHAGADSIIQELKRDPLIEAFRVLTLEGDNWYNAGEFDRAIEPYEQALVLNPDDIDALNRVAIAHNGARLGSIAAHQLRAIELLEKAVSKTRQVDPIRWAMTQNNLGKSYTKLPTGDRRKNLTRAILAYKSALEVWTREAHPVDWAAGQNNLGAAYQYLPTGDRGENLTQSILAYESVLEVITRETHPIAWATTQNNLGLAYADLSTGDRGENLTRAIRAYKLALKVTTREVHPVDWAGTQNNLGNAYGDLLAGDRGENLIRAIRAYELALEVTTRKAHPADWARIQNNLGATYSSPSTGGDRGENLTRAIRAYQLALEVRTRKAHPVSWAMTQYNLALCLSEMANVDSEKKCEWLEKAIACSKATLDVFTAEAFPHEHPGAMKNLRITREAYEAVGCAEQRPIDEIVPAE